MVDYNPDLIAEALDEFRVAEAYSPQAPGGAAAARATVARRRRVKVTTFSVLGALLIAVPIAAFAAHPRGNNPPPVVTNSGTPSPVLSPTPSSSPSGPPAREARFTREQLTAAKARVPEQPDWSCPYLLGPELMVRMVVHTNLDDDPTLETAALVVCSSDDLNRSQVAAYDIDDAGAPVLLGAVVNSLHPHDIVDLGSRQGGGVVAVVAYSEELRQPGQPPDQRREFAWDGRTFEQVGGPVGFPERKPAELSITAEPLVLGPVENGKRKGTLKVTVANNGPNPSQQLEIELAMPGVKILRPYGLTNIYKQVPLDPKGIATFPIEIEVDASTTQPAFGVGLYSWIDDPKPENNYVEVSITYL